MTFLIFPDSPETAVVVNGVEAEELLKNIAADLRQILPLEAQLPSENIIFPTTGQVIFNSILFQINVTND